VRAGADRAGTFTTGTFTTVCERDGLKATLRDVDSPCVLPPRRSPHLAVRHLGPLTLLLVLTLTLAGTSASAASGQPRVEQARVAQSTAHRVSAQLTSSTCKGRWTRGHGTRSSHSVASSCRWSVTGSSAVVRASRGPDQGLVDVSVDGGRAHRVDLWAEKRVANTVVLTVAHLRGKHHTVVLRVLGRHAAHSDGSTVTLPTAAGQPAQGPTSAGQPAQGPTTAPAPAVGPSSPFVQHVGSGLQLGGQPFRFGGTNMYWLTLDDNVRDASGPTYPTPYRIDDAMTDAQDMHATVVRAWANTVGCARCIEPALGHFNDAAFTGLDQAVQSAHAHGIYLALDLADNWAYYNGGKLTYTGWRGKGEAAFFSDPTVLHDYLTFIDHVLSHVNPLTGLAYRDDPTIMGWETGNEMWCQTCPGNFWDGSWTRAVADHIKAVAPRQLVIDGHGVDNTCTTGCLSTADLQVASVDVVDDHFYPMHTARVADASAQAAAYGKAYLVGEYDWVQHDAGGDPLPAFLSAVERSSAAGDLTWALVPHYDDGGLVDHNDGFQMFYPGTSADQRSREDLLRAHAATLAGAGSPGAHLAPGAPVLLTVTAGSAGTRIVWRGAALAAGYTLQRSTDAGQTWTTVATGLPDTLSDLNPGYTDVAPPAGATYRMAAVNLDGAAGPWSVARGA